MAPTRQQLMRCVAEVNRSRSGTVCASLELNDDRQTHTVRVYHSGLSPEDEARIRAICGEYAPFVELVRRKDYAPQDYYRPRLL